MFSMICCEWNMGLWDLEIIAFCFLESIRCAIIFGGIGVLYFVLWKIFVSTCLDSKCYLAWIELHLFSRQTASEEDVPAAAITRHGAADLLQPDADWWRILPNRQHSAGPSGIPKFPSGLPHVSHPPASGPAAGQPSGLTSIQPRS